MKNDISLSFSLEQAQELSYGISDILCWIRGFRAGSRETRNDPLGDEVLREFNIKLKKVIEAIEKPGKDYRDD
jgi:hypothetical protein